MKGRKKDERGTSIFIHTKSIYSRFLLNGKTKTPLSIRTSSANTEQLAYYLISFG